MTFYLKCPGVGEGNEQHEHDHRPAVSNLGQVRWVEAGVHGKFGDRTVESEEEGGEEVHPDADRLVVPGHAWCSDIRHWFGRDIS